MNPTRITADLNERVNDVLENAKLVHGNTVANAAFFLTMITSLGKLTHAAAHTVCGTELHETAMNFMTVQLQQVIAAHFEVLGVNEQQTKTACEVAVAMERQIDAAKNQLNQG